MPKSPKCPDHLSSKKRQQTEDFLKTKKGRKLMLAILMLAMEHKDDWTTDNVEKLINSVSGIADAFGIESDDALYAMCDLKLKQANPKLPDLLSS